MDELILAAILGGVGGLVRSLFGLAKAVLAKRIVHWNYFMLCVFIAVVLGVFSGMIFKFNTSAALLAGYAGIDILDGMYKEFISQKWMSSVVKG